MKSRTETKFGRYIENNQGGLFSGIIAQERLALITLQNLKS